MLKELTEYDNSIKKTQAEIKVTLSEIKKNLQGTSNGRDEAENQINNLEHKRKRRKRIQKNGDRLRNLWDIF